MFSVIFEVHPRPEQRDNYFGNAKMLRPELEKVDGFADNIRYRSLTREGWILSLSSWRDERLLERGTEPPSFVEGGSFALRAFPRIGHEARR